MAGIPQRKTEQTARAGQHQALDQQLTHDAPAAGAERQAKRDVSRSIGRASQQQIRDVGARDELHEADGAEQGQIDAKNTRRYCQRLDDGRGIAVRVRIAGRRAMR